MKRDSIQQNFGQPGMPSAPPPGEIQRSKQRQFHPAAHMAHHSHLPPLGVTDANMSGNGNATSNATYTPASPAQSRPHAPVPPSVHGLNRSKMEANRNMPQATGPKPPKEPMGPREPHPPCQPKLEHGYDRSHRTYKERAIARHEHQSMERPQPGTDKSLTYIEKTQQHRQGLHLPNINDNKGAAARTQMRVKPRRQIINLDVVDTSETTDVKLPSLRNAPPVPVIQLIPRATPIMPGHQGPPQHRGMGSPSPVMYQGPSQSNMEMSSSPVPVVAKSPLTRCKPVLYHNQVAKVTGMSQHMGPAREPTPIAGVVPQTSPHMLAAAHPMSPTMAAAGAVNGDISMSMSFNGVSLQLPSPMIPESPPGYIPDTIPSEHFPDRTASDHIVSATHERIILSPLDLGFLSPKPPSLSKPEGSRTRPPPRLVDQVETTPKQSNSSASLKHSLDGSDPHGTRGSNSGPSACDKTRKKRRVSRF